jgi:hypothetical protein
VNLISASGLSVALYLILYHPVLNRREHEQLYHLEYNVMQSIESEPTFGGTCLVATSFLLISLLAYSLTLTVEVTCLPEMLFEF